MKLSGFSDWCVNITEDGDETYPNGDPWKVWEDPLSQVILSAGDQMRRSAFEKNIDLSDTQMTISVGDRQFILRFTLLKPCKEKLK